MGGWLRPLGPGLPAWGPDMDWNTQCDPRAAELMAGHARLTLVPLPVAARSHLRAAHLPRLAASGPLGELLARQCEAYAVDAGMTELGRAHAGLPDDLVNFHWDPVACAVALGWSGAVVQEQRVRDRPRSGATAVRGRRRRTPDARAHRPGRASLRRHLDRGRRAGSAVADQRCSCWVPVEWDSTDEEKTPTL
ncbi:hypothetical protein GCM10020220_037140 [Nonomuraea rubra]